MKASFLLSFKKLSEATMLFNHTHYTLWGRDSSKIDSYLLFPSWHKRFSLLHKIYFCHGIVGMLILAMPSLVVGDSLWKDTEVRSLVGDRQALAVGDIVTIVVQENTTTEKDNSTRTSRKSGANASFSSFLYPPSTGTGLIGKNGELLKFNGSTDHAGGGTINNSEKIVARIAVRVIDVLPNRNLVIEGSRETAFSGEKQTAILRGTVRPEDITGNNTVLSYNIADATIKFVSKGTITDAQRKGWFLRVWEKLSPF